jgi:fluoroquinolone resistance protein
MNERYFADQKFDTKNTKDKNWQAGDYEHCIFTGIDFARATLADFHFIDCRFDHCDLAMTVLNKNTSFRDVAFVQCRLQGVIFSNCNGFLFSAAFEYCNLKYASFFDMKLKKTPFKECDLEEADFTGSDLTQAMFEQCDLKGTHFENTILEKADFRSSVNYSIDPEKNKILKARFSFPAAAGLLDKYGVDLT